MRDEGQLLVDDVDPCFAGIVDGCKASGLASHLQVTGVGRPITASFGIAAFPDDAAEPALLIRGADRALYLAKENGRNRIEAIARAGLEAAGLDVSALERE